MRSSLQLLCIEPVLSMTDRIFERFVVIKERLSSTAYIQACGSSNPARCGDALCYSGEKCHTDASKRKFRR